MRQLHWFGVYPRCMRKLYGGTGVGKSELPGSAPLDHVVVALASTKKREVIFNQVIAGFKQCTFGTGVRRLSHLPGDNLISLHFFNSSIAPIANDQCIWAFDIVCKIVQILTFILYTFSKFWLLRAQKGVFPKAFGLFLTFPTRSKSLFKAFFRFSLSFYPSILMA